MWPFRVGFGYDVHPLVSGRPLWIGGVRIEHPFGLQGHSDADVLIHAICDALLGAAALGDLGRHFPDTSPLYKDIDSKRILQRTTDLICQAGYSVGNIDATVVAQAPRLSPYIPDMRTALSPILRIHPNDLSIKATTTEQLGFAGREEGIAAYAVALLFRGPEPKTCS
ncbi:MAG: 2-C-methyl-D-erythritol 2,4-cyclodiphosphate synthase [Tannerellaceae bacterium]|jgi:2-C-methyl-D-erythritol 2,4-cyclodiphosphate synthase|nr:2-C-methyl-D-erythritol 2,4-cyclodiphosphate synthase [Tannerellaceae bacterium]